jgi:hypothetical protein
MPDAPVHLYEPDEEEEGLEAEEIAEAVPEAE